MKINYFIFSIIFFFSIVSCNKGYDINNTDYDNISGNDFQELVKNYMHNDSLMEEILLDIGKSPAITIQRKVFLLSSASDISDGYLSESLAVTLANIFMSNPLDFILSISQIENPEKTLMLFEYGLEVLTAYYAEIICNIKKYLQSYKKVLQKNDKILVENFIIKHLIFCDERKDSVTD